MPEVKTVIDDDRCTGHGRCYAVVPALFDADDMGRGTLIVQDELTDEQVQEARTAELNCPERAISLVD